MTREIKFRAWDKANKKWIKDDSFVVSPQYGGPLPWRSDGKIGFASDFDADLCQYTGLKDRNGKEIYEGDILRLDSIRTTGSVIWGHQGWEVDGHDDISLTMFEIIGSIYQNPELISKSND